MVLRGRLRGRVGRRRTFFRRGVTYGGPSSHVQMLFADHVGLRSNDVRLLGVPAIVRPPTSATLCHGRGRGAATDRRPGSSRPAEPEIPEDVTWHDLDREARSELRSLPKEMAERVGGHLAMAGILVDSDPETALAHAAVARRLASRVAVVREASALTAYACGDFDTALTELRAYRRMSGDQSHLPLMADCERGLGRPERALDLAATPEAKALAPDVAQRAAHRGGRSQV